MNVRPYFFVSATITVTLLFGCGSSSNRDGGNTPDDVSSTTSSTNEGSGSSTTHKSKTDQPDNDTKEMPHGPKSTNDGNSVPEDYTLTDRDCIELAKQYGVVQKADQMVVLSPKLSTDQKAQAEKSIDDAVVRLRENWENGCRTSLVGGVVERARLKCAMMTAKSVKGFDECINGEPPK